jgi:hypothetical protein
LAVSAVDISLAVPELRKHTEEQTRSTDKHRPQKRAGDTPRESGVVVLAKATMTIILSPKDVMPSPLYENNNHEKHGKKMQNG